MKYCQYCDQMVAESKHINWFVLILATLCTGGFWLLLYIPYYFFIKSPCCPMCGNKF